LSLVCGGFNYTGDNKSQVSLNTAFHFRHSSCSKFARIRSK